LGTGIAAPCSKVINAVIDHDCPRAKIVPVLPLTVLTPPNITVDPAAVGNAVTVMVDPWSYLPIASGAGLKANNPFSISKTAWPGSNKLPFTDNCIP
jgi:hypothetical protein